MKALRPFIAAFVPIALFFYLFVQTKIPFEMGGVDLIYIALSFAIISWVVIKIDSDDHDGSSPNFRTVGACYLVSMAMLLLMEMAKQQYLYVQAVNALQHIVSSYNLSDDILHNKFPDVLTILEGRLGHYTTNKPSGDLGISIIGLSIASFIPGLFLGVLVQHVRSSGKWESLKPTAKEHQ